MPSFDAVVSEALLIIGSSGDDELARLMTQQWVWRALTDMPVSEEDIKVCRIDAKNLLLKKPSDMQQYIEMALYSSNDCLIPHVFRAGKKRIYPNTEGYVYTNNEGEVTQYYPVDVSEDRHSFILGTNGTNVSYALVRYFAWPLDTNGFPYIKEEDVLTCVLFARYMMALRKNENQSEIQQSSILYKQEADRARARRKVADLSNDKKKTIANMWNRMIPIFNRSRF